MQGARRQTPRSHRHHKRDRHPAVAGNVERPTRLPDDFLALTAQRVPEVSPSRVGVRCGRDVHGRAVRWRDRARPSFWQTSGPWPSPAGMRRSRTWPTTFSRSPSAIGASSASKTTGLASSTPMRARANGIPVPWRRSPSLTASCSTSCSKGSARCVTTAASAHARAPPCRRYVAGSHRQPRQTRSLNRPLQRRHRPLCCAAPSAVRS
jgi:hypothetical protein